MVEPESPWRRAAVTALALDFPVAAGKFDEVVQVIIDITTKSMANLRESEQTFFSMLAFVAEHKPEIVILENVKNAPFGSARDHWFKVTPALPWHGRPAV